LFEIEYTAIKYDMATGNMKPPSRVDAHTINHIKRHHITCANIDVPSVANGEITKMLLHMFRDVYVHDDNGVDPNASILAIMFQVRMKTQLKIVNIELARRVNIEEYTFLFGSDNSLAMVQTTPDNEEDAAADVIVLYMDLKSIRTARRLEGGFSTPPVLMGFAHVVDAMNATLSSGEKNVFDVVVVEVCANDVRKNNKVCLAQYARTSEVYTFLSTARIVVKMYLQIELRGEVDTVADYRYGPFPKMEYKLSQATLP